MRFGITRKTPRMTNYKAGDVVLIPFPFTDLTATKQRPAVILSSNRFNRRQGDIIIAAITSHIPEKLSREDYILSPVDQRSAGLPKLSIVKLGKIVTIDQQLVRKRLGYLSPKTIKSIISSLFSRIFR